MILVFSSYLLESKEPTRQNFLTHVSSTQCAGWHDVILSANALTLFPNKPWFFTCLQYNSFENSVGKGEIARNEQFLLFLQCFLTLWRTFCHFHQIQNCRLQTLWVWKNPKFFVWERVNTPFLHDMALNPFSQIIILNPFFKEHSNKPLFTEHGPHSIIFHNNEHHEVQEDFVLDWALPRLEPGLPVSLSESLNSTSDSRSESSAACVSVCSNFAWIKSGLSLKNVLHNKLELSLNAT